MKERITVTIDKELLKWLDKKIDEKIFANRSHGLEFLIKRFGVRPFLKYLKLRFTIHKLRLKIKIFLLKLIYIIFEFFGVGGINDVVS